MPSDKGKQVLDLQKRIGALLGMIDALKKAA